VQGIGADVEIAQALDRASAAGVDVIVLARGGGSYEDLFAFNCEPVVRAIVRSQHPVITGIGHTADHHLADDVADFQCETPSNAAQFIARLWQQGSERLAQLRMRLEREMRDLLRHSAERADMSDERLLRAWERAAWQRHHRLAAAEERLTKQNPALRLTRHVARLTEFKTALRIWPARALSQWKYALESREKRVSDRRESYFTERTARLTLLQSRLTSSDPMNPLQRGYAIVTLEGRPIRSSRQAAIGDRIEAKLYRGTLIARVEGQVADE